jgi:hypothetical protein
MDVYVISVYVYYNIWANSITLLTNTITLALLVRRSKACILVLFLDSAKGAISEISYLNKHHLPCLYIIHSLKSE